MDLKVIIIIGFSYLYGLFEVLMNIRQRGQKYCYNFGRQREPQVVVRPHNGWLCLVICNWRNKSRPDQSLGRLFCSWRRIGTNRIDDQGAVDIDSQAILYVLRCQNRESHPDRNWAIQNHQASWIPGAIDDLRGDLDLTVELAGSSPDDDSGYDRVCLPNKGWKKSS